MQLLELEKENEERQNAMLRDLKHSKKLKAEGKYTSSMRSCTVEAINLEDDPDVIDTEELLGRKPRAMNNSPVFSNRNLTIEQLDMEQETSPFEAKNGEENNSKENLAEPLARPSSNWVKGISLIEGINKQPTSIAAPQNEVEIHKPYSVTGKTWNKVFIDQREDRNDFVFDVKFWYTV